MLRLLDRAPCVVDPAPAPEGRPLAALELRTLTGVPDVRSEWKVAREDARQFVAVRYGAVADVEPLRQGLWSSAYGFQRGGDDLVIRFSGLNDDFEKDAFVSRRAPPELPVPRIVEIGEALGGWYAVSRRLAGRHLDALNADEVRGALPSLLGVLDGVREIDLAGTSGYGSWVDDGRGAKPSWRTETLEVDRSASGWRERGAAAALAAEAFDSGLARLHELVVHCPEERHLVHSDLLHWNVLVEDERVTGLLDWGSSLIGDFVHDIAWLTFWSPWYPQWRGIEFARAARDHYSRIGLGVEEFDERLRCYELRIGLGNLDWYLSRRDDVNLERVARRIHALAQ